MPRFFVDKDAIGERDVVLGGGDAFHIARSLRMAVGDEITVSDGEGNEYACRLSRIRDEECTAEILTRGKASSESPVRISLYMAYPKSDKLELVIQKAVELGVFEIILRNLWQPKVQNLIRRLQQVR